MSSLPHPPPAAVQPAPAERPADAVEVGRILGAWGVKGGLKLKPFASDPQALFSSRRWYVEPADTAGSLRRPMPAKAHEALAGPLWLEVRQVRGHGEHIVASTPDISDRDVAQAMAGWRVFVERSSFPPPGDGEFYWVDLIGLQVVNREGVFLGTVSGLIETGPHCVVRVLAPGGAPGEAPGADGRERLIPFVDAYVDRVDLPGRRIHVDWDPSY